jgi:hypothetical protein
VSPRKINHVQSDDDGSPKKRRLFFRIISIEMNDDDDADALPMPPEKASRTLGLPILLRQQYHHMLPRFTEIATIASRLRLFSSWLINLHLQDHTHSLPAKGLLPNFLKQVQGLFCVPSGRQLYKSKCFIVNHQC